MKKVFAITALASVIGLTGLYSALAYPGAGGMGGHGGCGAAMQQKMAGMDDATKAKFKTFMQETQELRRSMAVKSAEKSALMAAENPNPAEIGKITGELFDLRSSMHAKAEAAGLADVMGRGPGCAGPGGQGLHHGRKAMMQEHNMMPKHQGK